MYEDKFDPILRDDELYTVGHKNISKENKVYQDKISNATNLIFIHPTWWQNIPAILKGFIDRVFTGGFAFTFKGKMPVGLLKNKSAVILTTTGGPRIFTVLFAGDYALKTMINTTLKFCGIKCKGFSVGKANTLIEENKHILENTVKKAMKFLKI